MTKRAAVVAQAAVTIWASEYAQEPNGTHASPVRCVEIAEKFLDAAEAACQDEDQ